MNGALTNVYGPATGPLGFPLTDAAARAVGRRLRDLPREPAYEYRRATFAPATAELPPGERADVSWITAEAPDRQGDLVLAGGMDDSQFRLNPLVTLNHAYWAPPAGRSVWRRWASVNGLAGVKAKTVYPERPESLPAAERWLPDAAFALVQAGLLAGKSIGFLPLKVRAPGDDEVHRRPELRNVRCVIEQWLLLEYACCYLPAQPHAVVEQVSKAADVPAVVWKALGLGPPVLRFPFTPLVEVERHLARRLAAIDLDALSRRAIADALDRLRGRV